MTPADPAADPATGLAARAAVRAGHRPPWTTALACAVAACAGTLALAWVAGWPAPAAVGLLAGASVAGVVRVTATAERRVATIAGTWLAAAGGVGVLAGVLAAVVSQVPWPPVPPIPYLAISPFVLLLAGVLAGFGAAAVALGVAPAGHVATAWRRVAVVAAVAFAALAVARLESKFLVVVAGVSILAVAVALGVSPPTDVLGWDVPPVAAGLAAVTVVGLGAAVHPVVARAAVASADTESGRAFLRRWFETVGSLDAVLAALAVGLSLSALLLAALAGARRLRLVGDAAGVGVASAGLLVAAVAAAIADVRPLVVFAGVAASLLVWDVGEYAVTLGREVGRRGATRRGELVHAAGGAALAVVAVGVAALTWWAAGLLSTAPAHVTVVATAAAAVGTLLLFLAVR